MNAGVEVKSSRAIACRMYGEGGTWLVEYANGNWHRTDGPRVLQLGPEHRGIMIISVKVDWKEMAIDYSTRRAVELEISSMRTRQRGGIIGHRDMCVFCGSGGATKPTHLPDTLNKCEPPAEMKYLVGLGRH